MRGKYIELWDTAKVLPAWRSNANYAADLIVRNRARYETVAAQTGCPWYFVAAIHSLEASLDFGTWLANGDPLSRPTVNVPKGLGRGMHLPISWEEGAVLSLRQDGIGQSDKWQQLEYLLLKLEGYNGFGYVNKGINSPYLFSGTQHYLKGKFTSDGVWDRNAVSAQLGCVAILKTLQSRGLIMNSPNSEATWFEFFRNNGAPKVIAHAGDTPVAIYSGSDIDDLITWRKEFPKAKQFLVASDSKPVPVLASAPLPAGSPFNTKLLEFYSIESNYSLVENDVLEFYSAGKSNGCVAYMSSALRRVGANVPIAEDSEGYNISLVTKPFSNWLEARGWQRVGAEDLEPGDICFTVPSDNDPDFPAHTYLFHSWSDKAAGVAWVIDNQGFTHERNIYEGGGGFNFSPFAYALRAS